MTAPRNAFWSNLKKTKNRKSPELVETAGVSLHDFPISGAIVPLHPEYPEHWHNFYEMVIVLGGTGRHQVAEIEQTICSGHVFIIPPKLKHAYHAPEHLSLINVCFRKDFSGLDNGTLTSVPGYQALFTLEPNFRQVDPKNHMLMLDPSQLTTVEYLAKRLVHEARKRPAGYEAMARALLVELICLLCRLYSAGSERPKYNPSRIEKVLKYLETEFREEIDLSSLHTRFHYSQRNFYRLFKAGTGLTPMAYLQQVRLKEAARLLKESDWPVTQIAFDVGFQDSNHFSRRFRDSFGMSPSQFRDV
ncbi:MAG: helix-turn-helix domain-containing protein [Verrucomicrobiota bacterium JB024]|nr:helix-turn-helix domain-containing protein [Verrucomicrobiota bacterium JB024]